MEREDDMRGGYYRPMHLHRARIGFDERGKVLAWDHVIVGQSITTGTVFGEFQVKNGIDGTATEGMRDPYPLPMRLTSAVDGEPRAQAQWRQPMLPCQPGRQEGLRTGASSQALSSGTSQRATMACGAEARAAMVTGADLWLAEAGVPGRPGHAVIPRSDLS